jgi:hypothetical protein
MFSETSVSRRECFLLNLPLSESYHGYWAEDIWSLNSHFGTESDLKALSDELHKRGMVRFSLTTWLASAAYCSSG